MMESTPRTRSSNYRRAPTPKLSERKKKLFSDDKTISGQTPPSLNPYVRLERIVSDTDEDSDLGPMSPLRFSSSPSTFQQFHNIIEPMRTHQRTDFTNILDDITSVEKYSLKKLTVNLGEKVKINHENDQKVRNDCEEDVVEPLCTSLKKMEASLAETSLQEEPMERNYEQLMKTPSELNAFWKNGSDHAARGISFRKSLIFDTGLTPHDDESSATPNLKTSEYEANERPKAKTSLTFNETTIPVKSFYGKTVDQVSSNEVRALNVNKISSHAFAAAITKSKSRGRSKTNVKLNNRKKAPSLWRFSGTMKFPKSHKPRHLTKRKSHANKNSSRVSTSSTGTNRAKEQIRPSDADKSVSSIEQNLRLQKILKDQTNSLNVSRVINWLPSAPTGNSCATVDRNAHTKFLDSDDDSDNDENNYALLNPHFHQDDEQAEDKGNEEPSANRKFFKSSSSSAKKYRIMGKLSATLKRGGDLKFEPPPKRKKSKPKGADTVILHDEITDIIGRLCSPSKDNPNNTNESIEIEVEVTESNKNDITKDIIAVVAENTETVENPPEIPSSDYVIDDLNKYRQLIPYNTSEPEKISQQESILELLITNGICNDETFQIFIAEPDLHQERATQILDSLYCVNTMIPDEYENEMSPQIFNANELDTIPTVVESQGVVPEPNNEYSESDNILTSMQADSTTKQNVDSESPDASKSNDSSSVQLFPIFNKSYSSNDTKGVKDSFTPLTKTSKDWIPIGNQQYQIDAGQKAFGMRQCPQCDMQYSTHEPEDELLHLRYHNSVHILTFKGWNSERIVTEIPEWGLGGRIIFVCEADSKAKKLRIKEVLGLVDKDLGFAVQSELKPKTLVYLAIAKQQIIGVCVAHSIERAHRLQTLNGIDCSTLETYPARCGISRIWVAHSYRRRGIASKLITSLRGHFLFGCFLSFDEIAFSSPTDSGKRLATSLSQREDFLIYEN